MLVQFFICTETFPSVEELKIHSKCSHDIGLDQRILENSDEEEKEPFVRFVKSMKIDSDYLKQRTKFYPQHWDHIEERIKIRLIAQMKLKKCSEEIRKNMDFNGTQKSTY